MNNWTEGSFRHAMMLINTRPPPSGVVDKEDQEIFGVMHAFSSAVKYVARHVSSRFPPTVREEDIEAMRASDNHRVLQEMMALVNQDKLPPFFKAMVKKLLADEYMEIPEPMFQVAFATERFWGDDKGKMEYYRKVSQVDSVAEQYVYDFLFNAGYNVKKRKE
jgi:hypothetical protein